MYESSCLECSISSKTTLELFTRQSCHYLIRCVSQQPTNNFELPSVTIAANPNAESVLSYIKPQRHKFDGLRLSHAPPVQVTRPVLEGILHEVVEKPRRWLLAELRVFVNPHKKIPIIIPAGPKTFFI